MGRDRLIPLIIVCVGPGTFDLYYKRSWDDVYLHYNPDGAGWNPIPGMVLWGFAVKTSFEVSHTANLTTVRYRRQDVAVVKRIVPI